MLYAFETQECKVILQQTLQASKREPRTVHVRSNQLLALPTTHPLFTFPHSTLPTDPSFLHRASHTLIQPLFRKPRHNSNPQTSNRADRHNIIHCKRDPKPCIWTTLTHQLILNCFQILSQIIWNRGLTFLLITFFTDSV